MRKLIVTSVECDTNFSTAQLCVAVHAVLDGVPYAVVEKVSLFVDTTVVKNTLLQLCIDKCITQLINATCPDEVVYEAQAVYETTTPHIITTAAATSWKYYTTNPQNLVTITSS